MQPNCLRASWFYHGARCFSFPIFSFPICAFPVEILCRVWYNNCMIRKGVSALALAKSRHRRRQRNRFPWRWVACGLALLYLLFGPSQAGNRIETLMFAAFAVGQVVAWFYLLLYFNSLPWQRRRKGPLFLRGQGQALVCGLVRSLDAGGTVREYGLATGAEFVRNSIFQSRAILPFAPHRGVSCSTSLAHADTSFSFAPSQGREL